MKHHALAAVTAVLLLTAACAQPPDPAALPPTASGPPDGGGRAVTVERTGGFAGRRDTVTVAPGGAWQHVDRTGQRRSGQLTAAQRRELDTLAADPRLTGEARRSPSQTSCQDAFAYRVTIETTTISYVDCPADPAPPAAAAVVAFVLSATRT